MDIYLLIGGFSNFCLLAKLLIQQKRVCCCSESSETYKGSAALSEWPGTRASFENPQRCVQQEQALAGSLLCGQGKQPRCNLILEDTTVVQNKPT